MGKRGRSYEGKKIPPYEMQRLNWIASSTEIMKEAGFTSLLSRNLQQKTASVVGHVRNTSNISTEDKCESQLKSQKRQEKQTQSQEHDTVDLDQVMAADQANHIRSTISQIILDQLSLQIKMVF